MKIRSFITATALTISVALVPALSQAGHGKACCCHHNMSQSGYSLFTQLEAMAANHEVNDGQRAKIRALADKFRPDMRKFGDQLRQAKHDLRAQMKSNAPDVAKIRAAAESKGKAMGELMVIRSQIRSAMDSIMPEQQREQFWRYQEKSGASHGEGRCKMCKMPGMSGKQGAHDEDGTPGKKSHGSEHAKPVEDPESAQR